VTGSWKMSEAIKIASAAEPKSTMQWWKTPQARKVGWSSLAVAILGLGYWIFFVHPYISTDDARVAATLVRVASEGVGGRVTKLAVTEGDRVKKGDVLLELDHREAEATLQKAKAKAEWAQKELKRVRELVHQHGLAMRELDQAQANADTSDAEMKLAQVAFDNTTIRSSVNGVVVQKATEEGNIVEPGQTLVTVTDIDAAWISSNIEETSIGDVKVGQLVKISVDEGGRLTGKVSEVRQATAAQFALIQSENPSGNFTKLVQRIPIKITLDSHPDQVLRSGQSVEIAIRVR
jgi:membrane fusion protein, multidrug efflux system